MDVYHPDLYPVVLIPVDVQSVPGLSGNTDGNNVLAPARNTVNHRSVQCLGVIGKLGGVRRQNVQRYIRPGLRLLPGSEHDNPHNNGQHKNRRPDRQNQCG